VAATTAATLEFVVGHVVIGAQRLPRPHSRGYDASGQCNRHDYELVIRVYNTGRERLQGYHVELAFPAKVVEEPMKHPGYVRDRSTRDMAFFRASGAMAPELFP